MQNNRAVLGIESSCDDTACAVVQPKPDSGGDILSSVLDSQIDLHSPYGGVVPEIAARAHAEKLDICAAEALRRAGVGFSDLSAIAVTAGPGLIGGVMAGVMFATGLAAGANLPLIPVNHLAGHALTPRLISGLPFPYLMLLISGGHCQFLIVRGENAYTRIGATIDDAPGEAFDKVARLLGLPQPGGPAVERESESGDPGRFLLPRPLLDRPGADMSFSGLKTAVLRERDKLASPDGALEPRDRRDLCASFQSAVKDVLVEKSRRAIQEFKSLCGPGASSFAVSGGVAANTAIRSALGELGEETQTEVIAPPLALCTDNGAMIAWAGIEQIMAGRKPDTPVACRPRWPLDPSAVPLVGSGKKGAKS